jgi:hypothetical protein
MQDISLVSDDMMAGEVRGQWLYQPKPLPAR